MKRKFDVTLGIRFANAIRKFEVEIDDEGEELDENDIQEIIWDRVQEYIDYSWKERT